MTALSHPTRADLFWRAVTGLFGAALVIIGVLGLAGTTSLWARQGPVVAGLAVNGALGVLSMLVGSILIACAVVSSRRAWSVVTFIGGLFLLSALVHLLVLNSGLNLLDFQFANVFFSFLAGLLLVTVGAYLRLDHPRRTLPVNRAERLTEITPMVEAEHAMAEGTATPEQERMVLADARERAATARLAAHQRDPQRRIKQYRREHPEVPHQRELSRPRIFTD